MEREAICESIMRGIQADLMSLTKADDVGERVWFDSKTCDAWCEALLIAVKGTIACAVNDGKADEAQRLIDLSLQGPPDFICVARGPLLILATLPACAFHAAMILPPGSWWWKQGQRPEGAEGEEVQEMVGSARAGDGPQPTQRPGRA